MPGEWPPAISAHIKFFFFKIHRVSAVRFGGDARFCRKRLRPRARGRHVAEGHWDARGTLGVDRTVPIGLTDIALNFELDADADAATLQRLVEMSERFCVIYQTLRAPPRLSVTHRIVVGA